MKTSISLLLLPAACPVKKKLGLASNSTFSLDKFEQNIKDIYPSGSGIRSYAISYLDKVDRWGAGRCLHCRRWIKSTRQKQDRNYSVLQNS